MGPLAIAGLVGQGLGLAGKLFGKSDDDIRQERYANLLGQIRGQRDRARNEAMILNKGVTARAIQGATQRHAAGGGQANLEQFLLPVQQQAATAGQQNIIHSTQPFDMAKMNADQSFADRPIGDNWADYASELGGGITQLGMGLDAQSNQQDSNDELNDILRFRAGMPPKARG